MKDTLILVRMGSTLNTLGMRQRAAGDLPGAERSYRQAIDVLGRVLRENPGHSRAVAVLGGTYCNLGVLYYTQKRFREAFEPYEESVRILEEAHGRSPRDEVARTYLRNAHTGRADVLVALDRNGEALASYDRALAVDPGRQPGLTRTIRAHRAVLTARSGDWRRAVAEADAVAGDGPASASLFVALARVYAAASATARRELGNGERVDPSRAEQFAAALSPCSSRPEMRVTSENRRRSIT